MTKLAGLAASYDYLNSLEKYAFLNGVLKNLGVLGQRMDDGTDLDEADFDEAIKGFFESMREENQ